LASRADRRIKAATGRLSGAGLVGAARAVAIVVLALNAVGIVLLASVSDANNSRKVARTPPSAGALATRPPPPNGAPPPTARTVAYHELKMGDCIMEPGETVIGVSLVPCGTPHDDEVFAVVRDSGPTYPGDDRRSDAEQKECARHFFSYVDRDAHTSSLNISTIGPSREGWVDGDRLALCLTGLRSGEKLTSSVRGSRR
jgi:hypothetical protein